jgi:hypothetical protein
MKRAVILYVSGGRRIQEEVDLSQHQKSLGVDALHLAFSEFDIAYYWWRLLVQGMQEVSCMRASYDDGSGSINAHGAPLRLFG